MKINRRTVLSTAAVLGVAALIAGGTIAYFTDTEKTDNNFTVGSVDVTLYESQLHRMNSGRTGTFSALASDSDTCDWTTSQTNPDGRGDMTTYVKTKYCTPNMQLTKNNTTGMSAIINGHENDKTTWISGHASDTTWGYSDETIKTDAGTYKTGYFARVAENIVPGQYVRKFAYVTNDGDSEAYVLIRYMIPKEVANKLTVEVPSTPYADHGVGAYFSAIGKENNKYVQIEAENSYEERIGDTDYVIYAAVTNDPVEPGEMTFWSPVNALKLNSTEEQTKENGSVSYPIDLFSVKVDAQAIQAKTFSDALDAINNL